MESHGQRVAPGQLRPDIIRNLKATNSHLRAEKDSAIHDLKRLQSSVRATQMSECSKENRVLLEEVDRLRQMNAVLKKQLVAKGEACAGQVDSLREELQQFKRDCKACVCYASQNDAWTREEWGYDEQSTAKKLLIRSRCSYDAIFNALRFCMESSTGANMTGANSSSRHPVDVQIRDLFDFLSQQGFRMQKELTRITGQPDVSAAENSSLKAPVKVKSPKPKPQRRPTGPPTGLADRLDAACLAVTASVEGLKTVAQDTFAHDTQMRACARSLGAVLTAFVKLHTQLEPSLTNPRSAPTIQSSQGSCNRERKQSTSGLGNARQHGVPISPAPSVSQPQMPVSGFFGSASLQSKGSGVSCTEVPSTNWSQVTNSIVHSQDGKAPATTTEINMVGEQDGATMDFDASADEQPAQAVHSCSGKAENSSSQGPAHCDEHVVEDRVPESFPLPTESEAIHEEPRATQSDSGACAPTNSAQPPSLGNCASRQYTTSISSSVFSDRVDPESSQVPKNSEASCSQRPSISQSGNPPLGLDTAASSVSLERSHGDGRSRPFEVASTARSDPNTSDRGYGSYSKLSCSDSGAGDTVDQPSVHPATSISTHQAGAEHEDIRGASGTDYSYSEADTEL